MAVTVTRMEPMEAVTPRPRPVWIDGVPEDGSEKRPVIHPYDGTEVATVSLPDAAQVERAVAGAAHFAGEKRSAGAPTAGHTLDRMATEVEKRGEEFAELLTAESAAPLTQTAAEVRLAVATLRHAARFAGQMRSTAAGPGLSAGSSAGEIVLTRRAPRGAALGIVTPHRPLVSAAGAVAAALVVDTSVVLTPTPRAPLSTLALAEVLADTLASEPGPPRPFSVLPLETPDLLADDPRLCPLTSPTGHSRAVVLPDWPDLDAAAAAVAASVADWAGRCHPPVRHVVAHAECAEPFVTALAAALRAHPTGEPYDTAVTVGPLADADTARRALAPVTEAVSRGATVVTGGEHSGPFVLPTLVTGVSPEESPHRGVLGPVVTLSVASTVEEALSTGLSPEPGARHVAVFTRDLDLALRAAESTVADRLVIGDVPRHRPDDVHAVVRALGREVVTVLAGRGAH